MLRLRKILLYDYLYYVLFVIAIISVLISINQKSLYNESSKKVIGTILSIKERNNKTTYIVKGKEKIIVYLNSNNKYKLGDKVLIKGIFNHNNYYRSKKIYYSINATSIKRLKRNNNIIYKLKEIIINYISNPYLKTFILGDKSDINKDIMRSYQENEISHLFAISGMHIALLSSIIERIIKRIFSEENRYKVISIFLILYLFLVGLSPSILRGVLFYILFKGNNIYYFYIKKENVFLLVLSISLIINPFYIYDIGFKYSFLISYALLKMSDKLLSNNKIISLLKVSLLSFIVSIPISLNNYYQINLLSIIYNLFYVPFISIVVFPLSLIVLIIKPLEPIYNLLIIILDLLEN